MDTGMDEARGPDDGGVPARTSLEKRAPSGGGPGDTIAVSEPLGWAAPAVHDQQTVTSVPPWVNPSATPVSGAGGAFAPPGPVPSANGSAANPFAPPAAPYGHGGPVPPPPIGPDGPGQVPYGYPGYGCPPGGEYGWPGAPMPSNGLGTAGLVLGIISAAVFCVWPVAIIVGVLALVFGSIGRGRARRGEATNAGQALAGVICGAAGVVLGFVMLAFVIATR
jgi:hypothetical protein